MPRTRLAALLSLSLPVLADETVQYDFINNGKREGGQTVVYRDNGTVEVEFQFNDRDRGPKIREIFALDKHGLLTATTITGNSIIGEIMDAA